MKNRLLRVVVGIILLASYIGVFFVMAIMDLVNTKDIHVASVDAASELLVVENSINGLIPTGKDYYYIGMDEETGSIYSIHAGKKWLEKNFDAEGYANGNGVAIKGLAKRVSDYKVENEIVARVNQIAYGVAEEGYALALEPGRVLELNYVSDAIMRIAAGILILVIGILMVALRKNADQIPTWARKAFVAVLVVVLLFSLKTII